MVRLLGGLARAGAAAAVLLLLLTLFRFGPVYAEPPWPLAAVTGRALPLFAVAVLLVILAAACGTPGSLGASGLRQLLLGLLVTAGLLGAVVLVRPASGLSASVSEGDVPQGVVTPGPVDLIGRDLQSLPRLRRPRLEWAGELRAPETGAYLFWVEGRGRLQVQLDGWPVLEGDGDPLRVEARLPLTRGPHRLAIHLQRDGPGARLRFGWAKPSSGARLVIPPRALGPALPGGWWLATDAVAFALAALVGALVYVLPWAERRVLPSPRPTSTAEVLAAALGYGVLLA
ncbi:MAG TPA: hypothetical protein VIZ31_10980, partial [Vicinamibacteria bacterium]